MLYRVNRILVILVVFQLSLPVQKGFTGEIAEYNLQTALPSRVITQGFKEAYRSLEIKNSLNRNLQRIKPVVGQSSGELPFLDNHRISYYSVGDAIIFKFYADGEETVTMNIDIANSSLKKRMKSNAIFLTSMVDYLAPFVIDEFQNEFSKFGKGEFNFRHKIFRFSNMFHGRLKELNEELSKKTSQFYHFRMVISEGDFDPEDDIIQMPRSNRVWNLKKANPVMVYGDALFIRSYKDWMRMLGVKTEKAKAVDLISKEDLDRLSLEYGVKRVNRKLINVIDPTVDFLEYKGAKKLPIPAFDVREEIRVVIMLKFENESMFKSPAFQKAFEKSLFESAEMQEVQDIQELLVSDRLMVSFPLDKLETAYKYLLKMKDLYPESSGGLSLGNVQRAEYTDYEGNAKAAIYGESVINAAMLSSISAKMGNSILIDTGAGARLLRDNIINMHDSEMVEVMAKHLKAWVLIKKKVESESAGNAITKVDTKNGFKSFEDYQLITSILDNPSLVQAPITVTLRFKINGKLEERDFHVFRLSRWNKEYQNNQATVIMEVLPGETESELLNKRERIEMNFFKELFKHGYDVGKEGNHYVQLYSKEIKDKIKNDKISLLEITLKATQQLKHRKRIQLGLLLKNVKRQSIQLKYNLLERFEPSKAPIVDSYVRDSFQRYFSNAFELSEEQVFLSAA